MPGNVFDVMEARCVLGVFHWLGAGGAPSISNWKLLLFVMNNSCVDARPSLVLWMLLQLLAPLGELVPQINGPEARVGGDAGVCAACESSVWRGCRKGTTVACLQGTGCPYRGGSGPALL